MKKILLSLSLGTVPIILQAASAINTCKLQQEFAQVGIYNPQSPELYNEKRAAEIIKCLETKTFRPLAQTLRRQQLESLQTRPATGELHRLQQENSELRQHTKHLQETVAHLRKKNSAQEPADLAPLQTRFNQIALTSSDLITGANDLTLSATEAIQRLINPQNEVAAQQALEDLRSKIQTIHAIQAQLTELISQAA